MYKNNNMKFLKAIVKYNGAIGALLCNRCRVIIKTHLTKEEFEGKTNKVLCDTCEKKGVHITRNAIQTPDGTIIESKHRHDFVVYTDKNGKQYGVDGGKDYLKRMGDIKDCIELSEIEYNN